MSRVVQLMVWTTLMIIIGSVHLEEGGMYRTRYTPSYIAQFDDSGIQKLFSLFTNVKCKYNLLGHCKRGTVKVDPWLINALRTQQKIALDEPINTVQVIATHNSFNSRADGYGGEDNVIRQVLRFFFKDSDIVLAQQEYSMTDQLNFGIRMLHLDPQWFWGDMRLCHSGNNFKWFNDLVEYIEKVFHVKIEFNSNQIGCSPFDRPWKDGIKEIYEWVESNDDQILMIYVNDHFSWDHNRTAMVVDPIRKYFANNRLLFTPEDKSALFQGKWPTYRQLLKHNKRVMVVGTEYACSFSDLMFCDSTWTPSYPDNSVKYFLKYPICLDQRSHEEGVRYEFNSTWSMVGGESVVYGPFYDGPSDGGLVLPNNISNMVDCGVKLISLDQASPLLVTNSIWTWAKDEPRLSSLHRCVYISNAKPQFENYKGTWYASSCDLNLHFACENDINPLNWIISNSTISLASSDKPHCPHGYHFSFPRLAYHSKMIKDQMTSRGISYAWINFTPPNIKSDPVSLFMKTKITNQ